MSTKRKYESDGAASRKKTKTIEVLLAEALKEIKELRKEVNQMKSPAKTPSHSHVYHHKDTPEFNSRFYKGDYVWVYYKGRCREARVIRVKAIPTTYNIMTGRVLESEYTYDVFLYCDSAQMRSVSEEELTRC